MCSGWLSAATRASMRAHIIITSAQSIIVASGSDDLDTSSGTGAGVQYRWLGRGIDDFLTIVGTIRHEMAHGAPCPAT
eukprot:scaffold57865_cov31-Tisochrysis_lutea.AAC.2